METKKCTLCEEEKNISDFYIQKTRNNKPFARCKECHLKINKKQPKERILWNGKLATRAQIKKWENQTGKTNESLIKHGMTKTRFYRLYQTLKERCEKRENNRFYLYGGRGIKCLWNSFEEFRDDMHVSYLEHVEEHGEKNTQIDRIDSEGHYCKENCRWATLIEQANNKRNNKIITHKGQTLTLSEWCRKLNLPMKLVWKRLNDGWSFEDAILKSKFRANRKPYESI